MAWCRPGDKPLSKQLMASLLVTLCVTQPQWVNAEAPGSCFTNVSGALLDILSKFVHCKIRTTYVNFKLKLCTCAQSQALGTCTKFQLEILTINVISGTVYFREIILASSPNVSETTPRFTAKSSLVGGGCWFDNPQGQVTASIHEAISVTIFLFVNLTLSLILAVIIQSIIII